MSIFKPVKTSNANNVTVDDGQFIVDTASNKAYADFSTGRVELTTKYELSNQANTITLSGSDGISSVIATGETIYPVISNNTGTVAGQNAEKTGYVYAKWEGENALVTSLYDGLTILYKVPVAGHGTYGTCLNLNNLGYHPVVTKVSDVITTRYPVNSYILLSYNSSTIGKIYDNTTASINAEPGAWVCLNDYDSGNTTPAGYCPTSASTTAKTASCSNYALLNNSYLTVIMQYANTSKNALTLNVNSRGAKPIYINGTIASSTNYTLPAGSYLTYYDGTGYHFRTDGKIPGPGIIGDAATVNGHSVNSDVPENAVFTDTNTTYTFGTGDANGQFKVTPSGGSAQNVSIKGLGSLAYKSSVSKSDVGLGNVDNTADSAKSVAYAESAGSVDWEDVNGHPTNYLVSGSQTTTSNSNGGSNVYTFTDAAGNKSTFTVKNGTQGTAAGFGTPTATVGTGTGTPSVTVTASGADTAKVFNFAFDGLKGAPGQNATTTSVATQQANGLMSKEDKKKLDELVSGGGGGGTSEPAFFVFDVMAVPQTESLDYAYKSEVEYICSISFDEFMQETGFNPSAASISFTTMPILRFGSEYYYYSGLNMYEDGSLVFSCVKDGSFDSFLVYPDSYYLSARRFFGSNRGMLIFNITSYAAPNSLEYEDESEELYLAGIINQASFINSTGLILDETMDSFMTFTKNIPVACFEGKYYYCSSIVEGPKPNGLIEDDFNISGDVASVILTFTALQITDEDEQIDSFILKIGQRDISESVFASRIHGNVSSSSGGGSAPVFHLNQNDDDEWELSPSMDELFNYINDGIIPIVIINNWTVLYAVYTEDGYAEYQSSYGYAVFLSGDPILAAETARPVTSWVYWWQDNSDENQGVYQNTLNLLNNGVQPIGLFGEATGGLNWQFEGAFGNQIAFSCLAADTLLVFSPGGTVEEVSISGFLGGGSGGAGGIYIFDVNGILADDIDSATQYELSVEWDDLISDTGIDFSEGIFEVIPILREQYEAGYKYYQLSNIVDFDGEQRLYFTKGNYFNSVKAEEECFEIVKSPYGTSVDKYTRQQVTQSQITEINDTIGDEVVTQKDILDAISDALDSKANPTVPALQSQVGGIHNPIYLNSSESFSQCEIMNFFTRTSYNNDTAALVPTATGTIATGRMSTNLTFSATIANPAESPYLVNNRKGIIISSILTNGCPVFCSYPITVSGNSSSVTISTQNVRVFNNTSATINYSDLKLYAHVLWYVE